MGNEPDPLQGHTREWPSTPYSDEARRERDVGPAVRQGTGESPDELDATRGLLQISLRVDVTLEGNASPPCGSWTGMTAHDQIVGGQVDAAEAMLGHLQGARDDIASGHDGR
jgi:hypothetical protein